MKRGRPAYLGVPVEFRNLKRWGKGARAVRCVEVVGLAQLEFPLDHLPAMFPDPVRQSCFMVRHD